MTTIDQLDISIYNLYAIRTRMLEQTNQELRLGEAASIPPQTILFDTYPKLTELDLLLGVAPVVTPWAYFFPPKRFKSIRRSPFAFFRVAPTLGSLEKQEEDEEKISSIECQSPEEERERRAILGCLTQVGKINEWLSFIIGRVGQFLQG
ncbi:MAG: DUF5399 domain-containing protein [Waddliaceae bacterium]